VPGSDSPLSPAFWFIMSMALLTGFVTAYPMNWWLVAHGLKHGMMTVRTAGAHEGRDDGHGNHHASHVPADHQHRVSSSTRVRMMALSFAVLGTGLAIGALFGGV
jgi:Domain of unknown function (DUF4396)